MEFICSAILFDLDGVLIDSSVVVTRHWKKWADRNKVPFKRVLEVMHGRPSAEIIRLVTPDLNAEEEAIQRESLEGVDTDGLEVIESAHALLCSMPPDSWGVVTSGNRKTAATRLGFGGFPPPAVLVTIDDVLRGKPDPAPYLLGSKWIGVHPAECIVIEDAPAGIAAATAAGMRTVAVATTTPPAHLSQADAIVQALKDVSVYSEDGRLHVNLKTSQAV